MHRVQVDRERVLVHKLVLSGCGGTMLHASKEHIAADLKVREFEIQQLELDLHVSNCLSVGLMAAIIASFSYNGIIQPPHGFDKWSGYEEKYGLVLPTAYYVVTYIVTFVQLVVVFLTTFSATLGPGYALRGQDGSILRAVRMLNKQVRSATTLFVFGVVLLFPSIAIFMYGQERKRVPQYSAVWVTLFICLFLLNVLGTRSWIRFRLPEDAAVRSHFTAADVRRVASGHAAVDAISSGAGARLATDTHPAALMKHDFSTVHGGTSAPAAAAQPGGTSPSCPSAFVPAGQAPPPALKGATKPVNAQQPSSSPEAQQPRSQRVRSVRFHDDLEGDGAMQATLPKPQILPPPPTPPPQHAAAGNYYDFDAVDGQQAVRLPVGTALDGQQPQPQRQRVESEASDVDGDADLEDATGCVRAGYLYKLPSSGRLGSWQRRYIVLSRYAIRWFPAEADFKLGKEPKGELQLTEYSAITQLVSEGLLVVNASSKRLTVRASAGEDLIDWRRDVERLLSELRRSHKSMQAAAERLNARRVYGDHLAIGRIDDQDQGIFMGSSTRLRDSPQSNSHTIDVQQHNLHNAARPDVIDRSIERLLRSIVGQNKMV